MKKTIPYIAFLFLLLTGCSQTPVTQIEYKDRPVLVPKRVFPDKGLLVRCEQDVKLTGGTLTVTNEDVVYQSRERAARLQRCATRMDAIIEWSGSENSEK